MNALQGLGLDRLEYLQPNPKPRTNKSPTRSRSTADQTLSHDPNSPNLEQRSGRRSKSKHAHHPYPHPFENPEQAPATMRGSVDAKHPIPPIIIVDPSGAPVAAAQTGKSGAPFHNVSKRKAKEGPNDASPVNAGTSHSASNSRSGSASTATTTSHARSHGSHPKFHFHKSRAQHSTSVDPKHPRPSITKHPEHYSVVEAGRLSDIMTPPSQKEELRLMLRTALTLGFVSFLICMLGTIILNIIFSNVTFVPPTTADQTDVYHSADNNFLFLAAIFLTMSCVLSIIGTVFLNLIIACVSSYIRHSRTRSMLSYCVLFPFVSLYCFQMAFNPENAVLKG